MRPSKFTSSLCTGEGGVFGGMYFYHSMFDLCHGQCAIWLKLLHFPFAVSSLRATRRGTSSTVWKRAEAGAAVVGPEVEQVKGWRWWLLVAWFALLASLHCLPAWFAALCLLSVVSALAGFLYLVTTGTLFWFVFGQPRAPLCPWDWGT